MNCLCVRGNWGDLNRARDDAIHMISLFISSK